MIKICKLCGQEFETNYSTKIICNREHFNVCPVCGKQFKVNASNYIKQTCSKACMKKLVSQRLSSEEVQSKIVATNMKKYGTARPLQSEEIKKQVRQTNRERYGADYPIQLEEFKEKQKATVLERYGTESVLQNEDVKKKIRQTNLERYGTEYPTGTEEVRRKVKATLQEHYGVDNPMKSAEVQAKAIETTLARYGVEHPAQSEEVQSKIRATNQERYGVDYPFQSDEIRAKINATNSERYGTPIPMHNSDIKAKQADTCIQRYGGYTYQSEELKKKVRATSLKRFGFEYPSSSPEIKAKVRNTNMDRRGVSHVFQDEAVKHKISESVSSKYGVAWNCLRPEAKNYKTISRINEAFSEKLNSMHIDYEFEFVIDNRSYDFYISEIAILIEINPTITHNSYMSIFDKDSTGLDPTYHLDKSKLAEEHGYRCVHIFDWEDQDKILSILKIDQTVYARKCYLREIDVKTICQFEESNHIQGKCSGQKVCYGLYYKGELIQVMTFGKPRYNKKYQWELLRLCTKAGYRVVGGASKMFKHFIDDYNPDSIISYCDRSKFNGEVYARIGMTHVRDTEPNKVWSKNDKRITNNLLMQRGYDQLFNTNYGKGISNEALMLQDGWLPVFDCGQSVYEWRKS